MTFVDPTRISEELGGEQAFRDLAAAGLGIILDIVPNHMGTGDENRWWVDETLRPKFFDVEGLDGRWRDVLTEVDHVLGGEAPLKDLAGEHGLAL
ncbi:MAG: hypothetical protein H0V26_00110, partial [Solirubrobacterales bacterium]|nr:hypothetical protein [Solirubrobacterales bacterium]